MLESKIFDVSFITPKKLLFETLYHEVCFTIAFMFYSKIIVHDTDYEMSYKVLLKLNKATLSYKIDILKSKQSLCLGKTLLRLSSVILVIFWNIESNEYK